MFTFTYLFAVIATAVAMDSPLSAVFISFRHNTPSNHNPFILTTNYFLLLPGYYQWNYKGTGEHFSLSQNGGDGWGRVGWLNECNNITIRRIYCKTRWKTAWVGIQAGSSGHPSPCELLIFPVNMMNDFLTHPHLCHFLWGNISNVSNIHLWGLRVRVRLRNQIQFNSLKSCASDSLNSSCQQWKIKIIKGSFSRGGGGGIV